MTRPTVAEVYRYRQAIDERVLAVLTSGNTRNVPLHLLEIGLQHEQQHQELLLTDLKYAFFCNPLLPAYADLNVDLQRLGPEVLRSRIARQLAPDDRVRFEPEAPGNQREAA